MKQMIKEYKAGGVNFEYKKKKVKSNKNIKKIEKKVECCLIDSDSNEENIILD